MLRISLSTTPATEPCLRLEGRLVGPWVAELERTVAVVGTPEAQLRLDLSRVQFVDSEGLALLCELRDHGVVLVNVTPFIGELLKSRPA